MHKNFKLTIPKTVLAELVVAAGKAAPLEACGLLAGRDGKAMKFFPMTNVDASPEHFSMKPEEQFAAVKDMRQMGLKMLAIWHSHPSSPPRMSEEDLRLAYTPDIVYVILSLAVSQDAALYGYRVTNGVPEQVEIAVNNN
ncbi:MAG: M67 family metallopeptidase [Kiritimatiellia bacterium]|nr:M67 family metallopeptidase [Kiritimatiellia bacterium]